MNTFHTFNILVAGGAATLVLSLAACASSPRTASNASMPAGQESSFHTPQGETGTPHGHGATTMGAGPARMAAPARAGSSSNPAAGVGQESSQHTPRGETGTPHTH